MLNKTMKMFTPPPPITGEAPASPSVHLLAFSTSNYDGMIKFLRDFGFTVAENPDQLVPFFEQGRGARVSRGGLQFQLEQSDLPDVRARFNLFITDATDEEVTRLKTLGYECKTEVSLYGEFNTFRTPDGGMFVL